MLVAMLVFGFTENSSPPVFDAPPSMQEVIQEANSESKLILIDFYAEWCGPCKQFTADSKKDSDMRETLKDVVMLKVDCESDEGRSLAKKYKIKSYPTFVVMHTNGKIESRWSGYAKAHFLNHLEDAIYE